MISNTSIISSNENNEINNNSSHLQVKKNLPSRLEPLRIS